MATPMIQSAAAQFVIGRSTIRPYVTALILEDRLAGTGQPPLTPRALLAQVTPPVGRWRGVAQASLPPLQGFVEESDETPELAWEVEVHPSGVFRPYAGVSTAILFFTKTNSGGTDHVWSYDVRADGALALG